MGTTKLKIWLSNYSYGEATLYVDNAEDGASIAECTIISGENYTPAELQKMLNLQKNIRLCLIFAKRVTNTTRRFTNAVRETTPVHGDVIGLIRILENILRMQKGWDNHNCLNRTL